MSKRHNRNFFFLADLNEIRGDVNRAATESERERAFRFSQILPSKSEPVSDTLLESLAIAMTAGEKKDSKVPAGYTYLGQFIDHDLTLDKTDVTLGTVVDVAQLRQGRSPALDLDCMYGLGPIAEPIFYQSDGIKLKLGKTKESPGNNISALPLDDFDLPRRGNATADPEESRTALIPDIRNDENLIVGQTHLAFIRFHNAVCDRLAGSAVPSALLFEKAREQVVKHYQWLIRHDFLPRIVDPTILDDVFNNGRRVFEIGGLGTPTMPIEFSVAAYRLGHAMIRDKYDWNAIFGQNGVFGDIGILLNMFRFSGTSGNLSPGTDVNKPLDGTFERLPTNWVADWTRLYDFATDGTPELSPETTLNFAKAIETSLTNPLAELPIGSFAKRGNTIVRPIEMNLAFRNLVRGKMVGLASGQEMSNHIAELVSGSQPPLTAEQILGNNLENLNSSERTKLSENTPLWFYVLREAELNQGKLGQVGGRIVAETFHRSIESSDISILRDPTFKPTFGPDDKTFRMSDLLKVAFKAAAGELRPLSPGAPRPTA